MFSQIRFLLAALILLPNALAQTPTNINLDQNSAVFVYNDTGDGFVFALNANPNGDLYFHMSAPAGNAWMGVGIGDEMANALMFIIYPSSNSTGVTISPRIALHGQSEPTYTSSVSCEKVWDADLADANSVTSYGDNGLLGDIIADVVCHNATSWTGAGGVHRSLNLSDASQPFIFAVGPGETFDSDDLEQPLNRHSYHGLFNMDMQQATTRSGASPGVPRPNASNGSYLLSGCSAIYDGTADNNLVPIVHAVFMCLTFIILFPFGALALRVLKRVMLHAAVQTLGVMCVIIGFGTGINISTQYNRSRDFNSAHQIIGLFVFSAVLIDFGLGLSHHLIWKKTQKQTPMRIAHLVLGPTAIILGVVNGGLGLDLAVNSAFDEDYIIVCVAVGVAFLGIRGGSFFCSSRRKQDEEDETELAAAASSSPEGAQPGYYRFDSNLQSYVLAPTAKEPTVSVSTAPEPDAQAPPSYRESMYIQPTTTSAAAPAPTPMPAPAPTPASTTARDLQPSKLYRGQGDSYQMVAFPSHQQQETRRTGLFGLASRSGGGGSSSSSNNNSKPKSKSKVSKQVLLAQQQELAHQEQERQRLQQQREAWARQQQEAREAQQAQQQAQQQQQLAQHYAQQQHAHAQAQYLQQQQQQHSPPTHQPSPQQLYTFPPPQSQPPAHAHPQYHFPAPAPAEHAQVSPFEEH